MRLKGICAVTLLLTVLTAVECSKKKQNHKPKKEDKDINKKVSSDKVPNGGRKGSMSNGSWQSSIPIAIQSLPLPIPKKKSKKKKNQKNASMKKRIGKNKKRGGKKPRNARVKDQTAGVKPMTVQMKRSTVELLDSSEVVRRMRRDVDDSVFSVEERKLRDEWLGLDGSHESTIPSRESASLIPRELKFIYDAEKTMADAYETIMPHIKARLQKRSLDDDDEGDSSDDVRVSDEKENESALTNEEIMLNNKLSDYDRAVDKREVTDYDLTDEELLSEEDAARAMHVREVSPEDEEYSDDVTEVVDDAEFTEPIRHTIVTREAPGCNGRSVRFE